MYELLLKCWAEKSSERISFGEIVSCITPQLEQQIEEVVEDPGKMKMLPTVTGGFAEDGEKGGATFDPNNAFGSANSGTEDPAQGPAIRDRNLPDDNEWKASRKHGGDVLISRGIVAVGKGKGGKAARSNQVAPAAGTPHTDENSYVPVAQSKADAANSAATLYATVPGPSEGRGANPEYVVPTGAEARPEYAVPSANVGALEGPDYIVPTAGAGGEMLYATADTVDASIAAPPPRPPGMGTLLQEAVNVVPQGSRDNGLGDTLICSECGIELEADARFCSGCGSKVGAAPCSN